MKIFTSTTCYIYGVAENLFLFDTIMHMDTDNSCLLSQPMIYTHMHLYFIMSEPTSHCCHLTLGSLATLPMPLVLMWMQLFCKCSEYAWENVTISHLQSNSWLYTSRLCVTSVTFLKEFISLCSFAVMSAQPRTAWCSLLWAWTCAPVSFNISFGLYGSPLLWIEIIRI